MDLKGLVCALHGLFQSVKQSIPRAVPYRHAVSSLHSIYRGHSWPRRSARKTCALQLARVWLTLQRFVALFLYIDPMTHTTDTLTSQPLLDQLHWRYATKKMDPAKPVAQDKVERILEAARLAPTSSGLQPFEIFVVTDAAVRAKIQPIAWNQAQITEGSHLLVFAAWDNYTVERINMMFDMTNEQRGFKNEGWENYRQMLLGLYPQRDADVNFEHAARQAYIGLSAALMAAAFEEVDSTPMEGFDANALDAILGLRARGLRSVAIMPLGYRALEGDWLVNLKKVRRPREQFITEV